MPPFASSPVSSLDAARKHGFASTWRRGEILRLAGEAKSYAERLFGFPEIGSLPAAAAREALERPANELGVRYEPAGCSAILELAQGYPYFIQEYGKHVWNLTDRSPITLADVEVAKPRVQRELDSSFFRSSC